MTGSACGWIGSGAGTHNRCGSCLGEGQDLEEAISNAIAIVGDHGACWVPASLVKASGGTARPGCNKSLAWGPP